MGEAARDHACRNDDEDNDPCRSVYRDCRIRSICRNFDTALIRTNQFGIGRTPSGIEIVEQCEFSQSIAELTIGIDFRRDAVARGTAETTRAFFPFFF